MPDFLYLCTCVFVFTRLVFRGSENATFKKWLSGWNFLEILELLYYVDRWTLHFLITIINEPEKKNRWTWWFIGDSCWKKQNVLTVCLYSVLVHLIPDPYVDKLTFLWPQVNKVQLFLSNYEWDHCKLGENVWNILETDKINIWKSLFSLPKPAHSNGIIHVRLWLFSTI